MTNVFEHVMDTHDFFDAVVHCNEDTPEWEEFLQGVAKTASEPGREGDVFTRFEDFMDGRGYRNQIADILYEAAKAYVNKSITESKADFDYC